MKIFLAGINCVGKSTVGRRLANCLEDHEFFDLDEEIENYYATTIKELEELYPDVDEARSRIARVLQVVAHQRAGENYVMALTPVCLKHPMLFVIDGIPDAIVVVMEDTIDGVVEKWIAYEKEQGPALITERRRKTYKRLVKDTMEYLKGSFKRADVTVDVSGCDPSEAALKVYEAIHGIQDQRRRKADDATKHAPQPVSKEMVRSSSGSTVQSARAAHTGENAEDGEAT